MSLDKAIKHGKEKRKQYRGSKAFDHTCRNHGSCDYCRSNREHKFEKTEKESELQLEEYLEETEEKIEDGEEEWDE